MSRKTEILIGLVLAAFLFLRGWTSLSVKSSTYDEWGHLENGITFLRPSDTRFHLDLADLINPPLARALAALPANPTSWSAQIHRDSPPARCRAEEKFHQRLSGFPFRFNLDSLALLRRCRLPILGFSLLGIPLLFLLARQLGRPGAGPWAALAYAASPNILAHARLMTPDLPVTVLLLATALAWLRLGERPSIARGILAGIVLGLALATKYSAGLLVPILGLTLVIAPAGTRVRTFWLSVFAGFVALFVLILVYAVVVVPVLAHVRFTSERAHEVERFSFLLDTWLGRNLGMPLVLYRYGAAIAGGAVMKSFLLGHHKFGGWLSYFPIVMSIKTPLAILFSLSLGLGWALRQRHRITPSMCWVAAIPSFYLAVTLALGIQVGLRHILPIYPFLALGTGLLLSTWWRQGKALRVASLFLVMAIIIEDITIHPHYLAYFNAGTGGPDRGYHYLVDCNLDWGQDLPALAEFQHRHGMKQLSLLYFGTDVPEHYGVKYEFLCRPKGRKRPPPGVYAVSATYRQGLYHFPNRMQELAWFRENPPTDLVAHSILIYDIRNPNRRGMKVEWD